jgi:hypothetical protein
MHGWLGKTRRPQMDEITTPFRSPFVGVATQHALGSPELKRWLLLFDEIVVDELETAIRLASDAEYKTAELEWLAGQGLLRQSRFDELPPIKDPNEMQRDRTDGRPLIANHSYSVFVEFVGQSAAGESHTAGGFGLRSACGRQCLEDKLFFGSL